MDRDCIAIAMIKPGNTVRVKRDIFRYEEVRHKLIGYDSEDFQSKDQEGKMDIIRQNHKVHENRQQILYAEEGEVGVVTDTFRSQNGRWNAKVRIGNQVKTFRLSSLEVV